MKTKENAFTLPVIITLYEFLFFSGPLKKRLLRLTPFLLTMLIIPVTLIGISRPAGEIIGQVSDPAGLGIEGVPGDHYFFTQFRVIVTYIRLLFMPVNQNLYHDYPVYRSFFEPPVLLSFLFLLSLFGAAVYLIYRSRQADKLASGPADNDSRFTIHTSRLLGFGILWFFVTLSVESSIIPIAMVIDEYRIYLPSVGFLLALVAGVVLILKQSSRFTIHHSRFTKVAFALLALVILGLVSATYARNALWEDKISLWEDVVRKSPAFPLGYVNLGLAYYEQGLYDKAAGMHERAIALLPVYLDAYINLGVAYSAAGKADLAIETYKKAMAMYPNNSILHYNLAHACAEGGRYEMAVENFLAAIRLEPYNSKAYHSLGTVYSRLGRFDDAIDAYSKFAALSPNDPEAYRNRGIAFESKGDSGNARADFEKACYLGSAESCKYLQDAKSR
jgi:tetratricopeptide (TPR) repeat protein